MFSFRFQSPSFGVAIVLTALALTGCSRHTLPGETGTVSGKISAGGQPPDANSVVVFLHQSTGIVGMGLVDAQGGFTLKMRGGPDILVGDYYVGVTPPESAAETAIVSSTPAKKETPAKSRVAKKYLTPETSGLTAAVKPGANQFEFDLK